MNRNVSIVVIILVLVVVAGYLVWLRSRYQPQLSPKVQEEVQVSIAPSPTMISSPSATPTTKEATGSVKTKSATTSSSGR